MTYPIIKANDPASIEFLELIDRSGGLVGASDAWGAVVRKTKLKSFKFDSVLLAAYVLWNMCAQGIIEPLERKDDQYFPVNEPIESFSMTLWEDMKIGFDNPGLPERFWFKRKAS